MSSPDKIRPLTATEMRDIQPPPPPYVVDKELIALGTRVRATYEATALLVQDSILTIMSLLHQVRQRLRHEPHFCRFVDDYIQVIPSERALEMARAWPGLQANRPLRELAQRDPEGAINTFQALGQLRNGEVPDDDPAMLRILSLPPAQRNREIRRLLDELETASPAALTEQVKALTAERDELARRVNVPTRLTLEDYIRQYHQLLASIDEFVDWSAGAVPVMDLGEPEPAWAMTWQERLADIERDIQERVQLLQAQWMSRDGG